MKILCIYINMGEGDKDEEGVGTCCAWVLHGVLYVRQLRR